MNATQPEAVYLDLGTIAARLGLGSTDVISGWIRAGELIASNVGTNPDGRPTWRVAEADLNEFLAARRAKPKARRKKQVA
jgi:hypothetical protein